MTTRLRLQPLDEDSIEKEYAYMTNVPADENGFINYCAGLPREGFEAVIRKMKDHARGIGLPEGYVPETHYLLWDGDGIVGWFRLRHYLCDSLRTGAGHIGYSVREDCRGRGYATEGLRLLLKEAENIIPEREAFLRVNKTNPASLKVMLKNGARIAAEDEEHYLTRIPLRTDDRAPVMTSERIDYVRLTPELLDEYLTMVNDAETARMISGLGMSVGKADELLWVAEHRRRGCSLFSMIERETGKFIGNIELFDITEDTATLGICITPAMQGRRFGSESVRRICAYAFEDLGLAKVRLNVFSFNPRAMRCYEGAGFVKTDAQPAPDCAVPGAEEYTMELPKAALRL